ncbi:MAG: sulfite exporter TauE/SafE family protein, partial [Bacteroidales bacterium]
TSSVYYIKHKMVDVKKALSLGVFLGIGSVLGALFAVGVEQIIFERAIGLVLFLMMLMMIFKPQLWENGSPKLLAKKLNWKTVLVFLAIGFYGGFIYVGLGYLLLAALVGMIGFDLIKATALKNVLVFIFIPFTLIVFMWNGNVNYAYGFVHAIGNVIGAFFASRLSVHKGVGFMRWLMIIILAIFTVHYSGLFDLRTLFDFKL